MSNPTNPSSKEVGPALEPPPAFNLRWCPACGRNDRVSTLKDTHYSSGGLCQGIPVTIEYARVSADSAGAMVVRNLVDTLISIEANAPECECEHDNEYCCVAVGEFCARCWAHVALVDYRAAAVPRDEAVDNRAAIALLEDWLKHPAQEDDGSLDRLKQLIDENRLSDRKFWPELSTEAAGWRDIETAPKDGTWILLWWPYWNFRVLLGRFYQSKWEAETAIGDEGDPPTHWMPLPAPPVTNP